MIEEMKMFREEMGSMKKAGGEEEVKKKVEEVVKGLGLEGIKSEWKQELKKQEVDIKRTLAKVVKEDEEVKESVRRLVKEMRASKGHLQKLLKRKRRSG